MKGAIQRWQCTNCRRRRCRCSCGCCCRCCRNCCCCCCCRCSLSALPPVLKPPLALSRDPGPGPAISSTIKVRRLASALLIILSPIKCKQMRKARERDDEEDGNLPLSQPDPHSCCNWPCDNAKGGNKGGGGEQQKNKISCMQ